MWNHGGRTYRVSRVVLLGTDSLINGRWMTVKQSVCHFANLAFELSWNFPGN
jgi:hypothetical protein